MLKKSALHVQPQGREVYAPHHQHANSGAYSIRICDRAERYSVAALLLMRAA
jgi:hypothetical protein